MKQPDTALSVGNALLSAEFRPYREEDYEAVCAFLIALNKKEKLNINWNWARFEWMMEHPEFDKQAIRSIGLWWEQGRIVGAAIYDMYFGEAFCAALPEYEALFPEILDYAYRELKDDAGLGIALRDGSFRQQAHIRPHIIRHLRNQTADID